MTRLLHAPLHVFVHRQLHSYIVRESERLRYVLILTLSE